MDTDLLLLEVHNVSPNKLYFIANITQPLHAYSTMWCAFEHIVISYAYTVSSFEWVKRSSFFKTKRTEAMHDLWNYLHRLQKSLKSPPLSDAWQPINTKMQIPRTSVYSISFFFACFLPLLYLVPYSHTVRLLPMTLSLECSKHPLYSLQFSVSWEMQVLKKMHSLQPFR